MKIKEIINKIPKLPLTALIFYLTAFVLWNLGFIPSPTEIFLFLEKLYANYGLLGLFAASFLEGIVYLGLYFPGSFIIAIAVFLSNGTFFSLISISLIVAFALTITSIINYVLGRHIVSRKRKDDEFFNKRQVASKGLFLSMLHPNSLAFYFFNLGIKKQNFLKIIFVPLIMIPYGLIFAYILYFFKSSLKSAVENPYVMVTIILIWFTMAFVVSIRGSKRR
ncbi:MAG: hypothetical protein KJ646_01070 [Nanoarchaeota archaeon]|nr:hypothetical protein [Nanoarchaeota archaeon]MBU4116200.1 hypothetical protein [Nanoarchaeota archaeon]